MINTKYFRYAIVVLLGLMLGLVGACKKKPEPAAAKMEKKAGHPRVLNFKKGRALDLKSRRKIGFPTQFKGVRQGQVQIKHREGLNDNGKVTTTALGQKAADKTDEKAANPAIKRTAAAPTAADPGPTNLQVKANSPQPQNKPNLPAAQPVAPATSVKVKK